jgi:hypothetical protein
VRTTFEQRLEGLEAKLLQMGQLVQSQLDRTLEALSSFDTTLADEVIVRDDQIDRAYVPWPCRRPWPRTSAWWPASSTSTPTSSGWATCA